MITLFLDRQKKKLKTPKIKASFSKINDKKKEGESSISEKPESRDNSNFEQPKFSSELEGSSKNEENHFKRMSEFEKCLKAIANQSNLQ